jgi:hypothetical protein
VVVSTRKASAEAKLHAQEIAQHLDWPYEDYWGSIKKARLRHEAEFSLVVSSEEVRLSWDDGNFKHHPGLSIYRIGNARPSPFIAALRPQWGERTLDTTLGFGRDALQVADRTQAPLLAFERNHIIALLTHLGLDDLARRKRFRKVCPHIKVIRGDGFRFMKNCQRNQFDLVLLDPLFPRPIKGSRDMEVLHKLVSPEPFDQEVVREAARVAKRRVVIRWPIEEAIPDLPFRQITVAKRKSFLHLMLDGRRY